MKTWGKRWVIKCGAEDQVMYNMCSTVLIRSNKLCAINSYSEDQIMENLPLTLLVRTY
jgi:hypothetical protein